MAVAKLSSTVLTIPAKTPCSNTLGCLSSMLKELRKAAKSSKAPVSFTTPIASMIPITKRIIWITPYWKTLGVRRSAIASIFMSLRLNISFTIQSTLNTQSAPRKGLNFVILWKVGINHNPPIPTKSISKRCHTLRRVSSPRYGIVIHSVSTLSGNMRCIITSGMSQAARHGSRRDRK